MKGILLYILTFVLSVIIYYSVIWFVNYAFHFSLTKEMMLAIALVLRLLIEVLP